MRRYPLTLAAIALLVAAATPERALAQGYGIYEHSACAMGRAGTGVAAPCNDGSAIFFNPAGIALEPNGVISLGGTLIGPRATFENRYTGIESQFKDNWYPVPAAYLIWPIGDRQAVGFGLFAPYGLTTEWADEDTFEGRFLAYHTGLSGVYMQPTYAISFNKKFSIGVGLDLSYADVELNRRVDLSSQPVPGTPFTWGNLGVPRPTDFADVNITGDTLQWGAHFGVIARPSERFSVGARYLTKQTVDIEGGEFVATQISTGLRLPVQVGPYPAGTPIDALVAPQFNEGATLGPQEGATEITFPDQFVVGVAFKPAPALTLLFDYQWVNWSVFDELTLDFEYAPSTTEEENYQDTNGLRFGAEFDLGEAAVLRAGYLWHEAAAPPESVTPLLPEGERNELTFGLGMRLGERFRVDAAYQRIWQEDRDGRTIPVTPGVTPNGTYTSNANLFGFGITWDF